MMMPEDDLKPGAEESQEMMELSFDSGNTPLEAKYDMALFTKRNFITHTRKQVCANNFNQLYRGVEVCRTCYVTYSLM